MPRGTRITRKQIATFLERVAAGDTHTEAAAAAGAASPSPFYARADRNDLVYDEVFAIAFREAIDAGAVYRRDDVDELVATRAKAPDATTADVALYAKRWHPGYREKTTHEHVGIGGGPVEVKVERDWDGLLDKFEQVVGLLRGGETVATELEARDGTEPRGLLTASSD